MLQFGYKKKNKEKQRITKMNTTLKSNLHQITTNKVAIKELRETNKTLLSEVLKELNIVIKDMKSNVTYKDCNKRQLATILKGQLDTKETVINVALNLIELNISVSPLHSLSALTDFIKGVKANKISKASLNKADFEAEKVMLKDYRQSLKA